MEIRIISEIDCIKKIIQLLTTWKWQCGNLKEKANPFVTFILEIRLLIMHELTQQIKNKKYHVFWFSISD